MVNTHFTFNDVVFSKLSTTKFYSSLFERTISNPVINIQLDLNQKTQLVLHKIHPTPINLFSSCTWPEVTKSA